MARKFQFKRGKKADLPTLAAGEPGFVTDEGKLYVGTGSANIPMARDDHTHTPAGIGAAAASHGHTRAQISDFPASMPASDVYAWAKAASKPGYTAAEVGAAAAGHTHDERYFTEAECLSASTAALLGGCNNPDGALVALKGLVDGKSASGHTHTRAQITDFPTSMPASDVYAWAKAPSKPGYSAAEVGAAASGHTHDDRYYTEGEVNSLLGSYATWGHGHDAGNITSGTLPVARGGTGQTSYGNTDYGSLHFRGMGLRSSDTNPTENGAINWTYG